MKKTLLLLLAALLILTCMPVWAANEPAGDGISAVPIKADLKGDSPQTVTLTDIAGHWAESEIRGMAASGLVKGEGNGKFEPELSMTRSEFAVLLYRAIGLQIRYIMAPDITKTFNDVKNDDWFANELNDLVTVNIVDDKGSFRPNDPITREEMMHYITNACSYKLGYSLEADTKLLDGCGDKDEISEKYKSDVCKGLKLGLINGRGNGRIVPKDKSTRAEAVVIIQRLMNALAEQSKKLAEVDVKADYEKTDTIFRMKLELANRSDIPVTITHNSGCRYDFVLLDANQNEIYRWAADKSFIAAVQNTSLKGGESIQWTEELDMKTYGTLVDRAVYLKAYIRGTSENFTVNPQGYEVNLKNTQTLSGISVQPGFEKTQDGVVLKVKIKNVVDMAVQITHPTGSKYDFALFDKAGKEIYRLSSETMALQVLTYTQLDKGESIEFTHKLDMKEYKSIIENAVSMKAYINETGDSRYFDPNGYVYEIDSVK